MCLVSPGMVDGWVNNEKCLARNFNTTPGIPLRKAAIVQAEDPQELKNFILEGYVRIRQVYFL